MRKGFLLSLLFCLGSFASFATTYYYQSGAFNTAGNWNTNTDGTGSPASDFTSGATDIWVLQAAGTFTVNAAWTVTGSLQIDGTCTITTNPSIAGGITVSSGGTLNQNVAATAVLPNMAAVQNGTIVYGTGNHTLPAGITYQNVTMTPTSTVTASGDVTVNGTLTVSSGKTLSMSTFRLVAGTSFAVTNSGTITTASAASQPIPSGYSYAGTVTYNGTGAQTIVAGTYLTLTTSGARGGANITLESGTIRLGTGTAGTLTLGATSVGSYITTGNTFAYGDLNAATNISNAITYNNLTLLNTSGTFTASGNITVNGTLTTTAGGTFAMSTFQLSAASVSHSGILTTLNTGTTPIPSGMTWGGTVSYINTTTPQNVVPNTYNNLTLGGASGTITYSATGDLTVNGTFNTALAGTTLDMGTNLLSGTMTTVTNNGTVKTANSTSTPIPSGKSWATGASAGVEYNGTGSQTVAAGTYTNLIISGARGGSDVITFGSGNVRVNAGTNGSLTLTATGATYSTTGNTFIYGKTTGGMTINSSIPYNNLTVTNTSGINTAGGDLTIGGTLTTTAGGTLDMSTYRILDGGSFAATNAGTLKVGNTSSGTPIPTGKNWAGTVDYNGGGSQTVMAGSYAALTISGDHLGGDITLENGNVSISGNFSLTSIGINSYITTGNTVTYRTAAGGQTVAGITYNNLTLSNTSGTNTAAGNVTVNGALTTTAGGTFSLSTFQLLGTLTVSNAGTITTLNTGSTPLPTGINWGTSTGTVSYSATGATTVMAGTYNNLTITGAKGTNNITLESGNIVVNGTPTGGATGVSGYTTTGNTFIYNKASGGALLPLSIPYNNLTVANTSGSYTLAASTNLTVNGDFTTSAGGTLALATNQFLGSPTSITHSGTITTTNTGSNPFPSGLNWAANGGTGTISYGGTTTATIVTGTYYNLTTTGAHVANAVTLESGNITVNNTLNWGASTTNFVNTGNTLVLNNASGNGTNINSTALTLNNLTLNNTSGSYKAGAGLVVNGGLTTTAGGTLDMQTSTLTGTLTAITNNGTIRTASTTNPPFVSGKDWGSAGTITYSATTGSQAVPAGTYNNLTFLNTSGTATVVGTPTINGMLTTTAGGTLAMNTFAPAGTFSVTNNGTISTTNTTATPLPTGMDWTANGGTGTVSYGGTTTATIMAGTYYNLTTTGAHTTNAVTLESGNIQVNNTLSWGASSSNFVNTGNTLILNNVAGNGANINSTALTLNNLTLNNTSSSYKAGGNLVVNGTLITTAGGTLDMQVSTLTGTLGTITNNGTIRTASTTNPAIASGKTWGGTVIFSATTGAQSIPAATFNNLTVLNTSATNTVVGTITVNGALTTTAGGTLSMTTFQLAGTPTVTHFGTISTANTGSNPFPSDLDWTNGGGTGTVSYGGTTTATIVTGTYYNLTATGAHVANTITLASGNIFVNNNLNWTATTSSYATTGNTLTLNSPTGSASTINTGALTFNNLTLNNTSGTYTAGAALTVNGVLTSSAGGTLVMGANALSLGGSASTSGTGTIQTANTTATPVTASKTWTQTLEFNSASAQTIVGGTYGGLILSNANTKTVANDVNVTGDLTIGASNTLADGGKIVTVSGNIFGSGVHSGAGKIVMNGASKSISGVTLGNLQLNNAAGFTLTGDPIINGTLTFTAGLLNLGANNLTFGTAGATASASSSSMIVATGVGEVRRNYAANGSFTFPIGDNVGPNYSPISVNFTGGTYGGGAYASAKVTKAVHPQNYSGTDYLTRYWTVNTSNITSPSYAVSATYVPGDVIGTESLIYMGQYSSSAWTQHNVTNTSTHTLTTNTNVTATSADFTGVGGPSVSVNSATICITGTVNLTASSTTPFTPVTYSWTPSTDLSASTGATVTASPTVTTVYTVTVTDSHGLTGTGTSTVTVVPQPSVNIGLSASGNICPTTVLTLTATPSDGTGTADYKWSGPGISGSPSSGAVASYTTMPSTSYTSIPPTAAGEYTVVLTYSGAGCSTVSATSSTITPSVHQWEGGASGDVNNWSNASNWVCGGVPAVSDHILIPNRTNQPTLAASATASMARLYVSSGATLTMGASSTVNLSGDFTNYGTITGPSTAKVVLNGSSAQNIGGGGNISNLELNNSAGATIANVAGDSTIVKGTLTLTSGTLTTNGKLMLYADATTNGRIGEITGGDISGNIVTQMWFQTVGHKAWHFFSHPFDNFIPLSMLQSSINMTGPGGSANGWTTAASNEPSSYYISPGTGWVAFNSSSDHLNRHQGIRLFVWGNIDEGIWGGTTSTSVRMRLYGHPNTGTQNVTLVKVASGSAIDYNQVANPYPSPVNIGQVIKDAFDLGKIVGPSYWLWNPALGTNGQYVTKAIDGSAFYISSGNSVQVRTTTNGNTLIFNESHKGTTPSLNLRTYSDGINLTVYDATYHPWDMLSVKFDQESTEREDNVDAGKPDGPADLNFYAISSDNVKLSSDVRPYAAGKVIPLGIGSNVKSQFLLKADKVDVPAGSRVYLHDKLLNKYQLLTQGAEYPFSINENEMSQGDNRFELTMAEPHAFDLHTSVTLEASLAPNPAVSEVAISYTTSGAENTVISVADVSGHILFTKDAGTARNGKVNVPLSQFASGVYLVTIASGDAKIEKTLIKE